MMQLPYDKVKEKYKSVDKNLLYTAIVENERVRLTLDSHEREIWFLSLYTCTGVLLGKWPFIGKTKEDAIKTMNEFGTWERVKEDKYRS